MSDKNYVNHEVQALKADFKEGLKTNDQHKFQEELQKIASSHPAEMKAVLQQMKNAGDHFTGKGENKHYDANLPKIDFDMGKGKDASKVARIDVIAQNKFGECGGLKDMSLDVNGKNVVLDKFETQRLNNEHNVTFSPAKELYDMKLANQVKVDQEAEKGNLVWKTASNGRLYPLNPEASSHVLNETKFVGAAADKVFSDNCHLWGRRDAMERYNAHMSNRENIIQKAITAAEQVFQTGRIEK